MLGVGACKRMDGGPHSIPIAFLEKCGDKSIINLSAESALKIIHFAFHAVVS